MRRTLALILLAPLSGLLLTACSGDDGSGGGGSDAAEALAADLASALTETGALVAAGDDAQAVADSDLADARKYVDIVTGMGAAVPTVEVADVTDDAVTLAWSWQLADDAEPWTYESTAEIEGDAIAWGASVVHPDLKKHDVLDATTLLADRGDITGAGGQVLVTERPVERYGIDKMQVDKSKVASSARALAELVGVDVAPFVKTVKESGESAFVEAITFRKGEVPAEVRSGVGDIPGAGVISDQLSLGPTREFAAPILGRVGPVTAEMIEDAPDVYEIGDVAGVSGLQARYDDQLRGAPGLVVEAVDPSRHRDRKLFEIEAQPGEDLAITLDERLQSTAEQLLADVGPASAIVALRPSDGSILAAANGPGTSGQNFATYGQFAPGSTFKIVSTLALLRAGLSPDDTVTCSPSVVVDGKRFENYDDYPSSELGDIPLRTAIAHSCNTAVISQAASLGKNDLADAAASLGLGIDHDLGFPAYFGQVPPPASDTEAAADTIGQGKVLASPMAMATVIASAQQGAVVVPRLVEQVDTAVPDGVEGPSKADAEALRAILRQVVTEGSGAGLADVPGEPVIAKTGTAEFDGDQGRQLHAWMVAAQGDLAVAVFVEVGESGSRTAGPILEAFLRAAG